MTKYKNKNDHLFVCIGCVDRCRLSCRISTEINNADLSICPKGTPPKFVPVGREDLRPWESRFPASVCTLCSPQKYFTDMKEFLIHILEHVPEDSQNSIPFTRIVFGRLPEKRKEKE